MPRPARHADLIRTTRGTRRVCAGFTLVELVLVVAIIGVLAAIAVPRLSQGSQPAGIAAAETNTVRLQQAIDMYAAEHMGTFPGARSDGKNAARSPEAFVNQLTMFTDVHGNVAELRDAKHHFGPYIHDDLPPISTGEFAGSNSVRITLANPHPDTVSLGGFGWVYNPNTGVIVANIVDAGGTSGPVAKEAEAGAKEATGGGVDTGVSATKPGG